METVRSKHVACSVQFELRWTGREDQVPGDRYVDIGPVCVNFVHDFADGVLHAFCCFVANYRVAVIGENNKKIGVGYLEFEGSRRHDGQARSVRVVRICMIFGVLA